jgi:hypothetical protein
MQRLRHGFARVDGWRTTAPAIKRRTRRIGDIGEEDRAPTSKLRDHIRIGHPTMHRANPSITNAT